MNWNTVIDFFQQLMIFILILIVVTCILTLISFDILAGTGIMMYLTSNKVEESLVISLATSGLLIALMFVGYSFTSNKKNLVKGIGAIVLLLAAGVYCLDVFFDSLTADYLRFGKIIDLKILPEGDVQWAFRVLIGGISTIGETLAISIIVGMPVLKEIISSSLPKKVDTERRPSTSNLNDILNKNKGNVRRYQQEILDKLPQRRN